MLANQIKEAIRNKYGRGRHHTLGSADLGACPRLSWYRRNKSEDILAITSDNQLRLMDGIYAHATILRMLEEILGVKCDYIGYPATAVLGDVSIYCRITAVITIPGIDEPFVLEVRRTSSRQFEQFEAGGLLAFPQWEERCFLHILAAQQSLHLDNPPQSAILLVQDRESSDISEAIVVYEEDRIAEFGKYIAVLEDAVRQTDPPDRPYPQGDRHCINCVARVACWGPSGEDRITDVHLEKEDRREALIIADLHQKHKSERDEAEVHLATHREDLTRLLDKYHSQKLEIHADSGYTLTASYSSSKRTVVEEDRLRELHPEIANEFLSKNVSKFVRVDGRGRKG